MCNKGKLNGTCNRTACNSKAPANWYNKTMDAHYCQPCAFLLNENPGDDLCVKVVSTATYRKEHNRILQRKADIDRRERLFIDDAQRCLQGLLDHTEFMYIKLDVPCIINNSQFTDMKGKFTGLSVDGVEVVLTDEVYTSKDMKMPSKSLYALDAEELLDIIEYIRDNK